MAPGWIDAGTHQLIVPAHARPPGDALQRWSEPRLIIVQLVAPYAVYSISILEKLATPLRVAWFLSCGSTTGSQHDSKAQDCDEQPDVTYGLFLANL